MTGHKIKPSETTPLTGLVSRIQGEGLKHLAKVTLERPDETVPTRSCGVRMDTVRALERKGLLEWRALAGAQGVRVTTLGYRVANAIWEAEEAAQDAAP